MATALEKLDSLEGQVETTSLLEIRGDNRATGRGETTGPSVFYSAPQAPTLLAPGCRHPSFVDSQKYSSTEIKILHWIANNIPLSEREIQEAYDRTKLSENEIRIIDDPKKQPIIRAVNAMQNLGAIGHFDKLIPYSFGNSFYEFMQEQIKWIDNAVEHERHKKRLELGRELNHDEAIEIRHRVAIEDTTQKQRYSIYFRIYHLALDGKLE